MNSVDALFGAFEDEMENDVVYRSCPSITYTNHIKSRKRIEKDGKCDELEPLKTRGACVAADANLPNRCGMIRSGYLS
jgi:hypothetical protein